MKILGFISPFNKAWNRMGSKLFKPFIFLVFLKIAFIAWLANIGGPYGCQSSGNFNGGDFSRMMNNHKESEQRPQYKCGNTEQVSAAGILHIASLDGIMQKAEASYSCSPIEKLKDSFYRLKKEMGAWFMIILVSAIALIVFIIILSFVLSWLRCRGKFMFIDTLVKDEGREISIKEKWRISKKLGNSYFIFSVIISLINLAATFLSLGVYALLLYQWIVDMINAGDFICPSGSVITFTVVWTLIFLIFSIAMVIVMITFDDIGTLMMYRRNVGAWTAFKHTLGTIVGNPVGIIQYLIIIIIYSIAATSFVAIVQFLTCCLCCIGYIMIMLPFVWMLAELPLFVFRQFFLIEFAKQFGDDFDADAKEMEKTEAAVKEALEGEPCSCV